MMKHLLTFVVIALSYLTMGALDHVPQLHQQKVTETGRYTIVHNYLGTSVQAYREAKLKSIDIERVSDINSLTDLNKRLRTNGLGNMGTNNFPTCK